MVAGSHNNPVIDTRLLPRLGQVSGRPSSDHINSHCSDNSSRSNSSRSSNNYNIISSSSSSSNISRSRSSMTTDMMPACDSDSAGMATRYTDEGKHNGFIRTTVIPDHSCLPSPLSPPLSVSPPSTLGPSMADFIATHPASSTVAMPDPSTASSLSSSSSSQQQQHSLAAPPPFVPFFQTSPEQWLAHAAEQRKKHMSTGSFSSMTSTTFPSHPSAATAATAAAPAPPRSSCSSSTSSRPLSHSPLGFSGSDSAPGEMSEHENEAPEPNLNVRPSVLRASLMARAKKSSARLKTPCTETMPREARLSSQSNQSLSSAFDSQPSNRSSSSSIDGWAPRARSSSVSSNGSNDSVNLDALIASGSDINEECLLDLEEADDVEWSSRELLNRKELQEQALANVASLDDPNEFDSDRYDPEHHWSDPDIMSVEDDPQFDETLREFKQMNIKTPPATEIRGLSFAGHRRQPSLNSRFPDGRNPFDLEVDHHMDTPAAPVQHSISNRSSIQSTVSSQRSSLGRLPAPSALRQPGAAGTGIKPPASKLAQPGARSMLAPPKAGATVGAAKPGLARPSGLQAPRTGLQPPRASSTLPAKSPSGLVKPGVSGLAAPGSRLPAGARAGATTGRAGVTAPGAAGAATTGAKRTLPGRTTPSTPAGTGIARPGTKSMLVAPGSARAPSRSGTATNLANRHSLLPSPASSTHSRTASTSSSTSRAGSTSMLMSPKRTQVSSTKNASTRLPASPASSTSSLSGLGSGHTSQRSIGSAGQLMRPKTQAANGRSVSMYGASSLLHQQAPLHHEEQEYGNFEEDDYSVLTPPQSPSSRDGRQRSSSNGHLNSGIKPGVRTLGGGIPRSGIAAPSRLIPPALSTSRIGRPASPSPASAGSNHSGSGLYFPRPHTPTSRITGSTGLVSPRAGRHA